MLYFIGLTMYNEISDFNSDLFLNQMSVVAFWYMHAYLMCIVKNNKHKTRLKPICIEQKP